MNFITLSVINDTIRILQSQKDFDFQLHDFFFSTTMDELVIPLRTRLWAGGTMPPISLMVYGNFRIALTDKVILELDSQVLSDVKLILLTVACECTSMS